MAAISKKYWYKEKGNNISIRRAGTSGKLELSQTIWQPLFQKIAFRKAIAIYLINLSANTT